MFIFTDGNGGVHQVGSGSDMIKALGQNSKQSVIITDESGQLIGAGFGVNEAMGSKPLVKALRDAQPLAKSFSERKTTVKATPKILFKKPEKTSFEDLYRTISGLQKSMSVGIAVSDDGASDDDVWSVIADFDTRISSMEANIKNISDFIASL